MVARLVIPGSLVCSALLALVWLLSDEDTRFALLGNHARRPGCREARPIPEAGPDKLACVDEEREAMRYPDTTIPVAIPPLQCYATVHPWDNVALAALDFVMKHEVPHQTAELAAAFRGVVVAANLSSPWWCQGIPWADSGIYSAGLTVGQRYRRNDTFPLGKRSRDANQPLGTRAAHLLLDFGVLEGGVVFPVPAGQLSPLHQAVETAVRNEGMECTWQSVMYAWHIRQNVLAMSIQGLPNLRAGTSVMLSCSCGCLFILTAIVARRLFRQRSLASGRSVTGKPRVHGLDIFKGLGMIGICASHFLHILTKPGVGASTIFEFGGYPVLFLPLTMLSQCYRCVSLLFIASGYLSQASLASALKKAPGKEASCWYHFVASRISRVYPLCVFLQLVMIVGEARHMNGPQGEDDNFARYTWVDVLKNAAFSSVWSGHGLSPYPVGSLWSIATSAQFWVLFPGLYLLMTHRKPTAPTVLTRAVQAGGIVVIWVGSFAVRKWDIDHHGVDDHHTPISFPKDSIFGRLDDFVAGALLCAFFSSGAIQLSGGMRVAVLSLGVCWLALACYAADAASLGAVPGWWSAGTAFLWQLGGCCVLLVFVTVESWPAPFLWLGSVGKASFSLMLWHSMMFDQLVYPMLAQLATVRVAAAQVLMAIGFSVYLTWISYRNFENPPASTEVAELKRQIAALKANHSSKAKQQ